MKRLLQLIALFSIGLTAYAQDLTITTAMVPNGRVGTAYALPLNATGGTAPYSWTITIGALPDGLAITSLGIAGTPTVDGTTTFTVQVQDSAVTPVTATKEVTLLVTTFWYPYFPPEAVTVCQMDSTKVPPVPAVDSITLLPRCFVIPTAVSDSMTRYLLAHTNGLDSNGNVAYLYSSWWDYVIKFFINGLVLPVMDQFPSPGVAEAKTQAELAAQAVDAAKAAVLAGIAQ
jgi:hypothetical protein